MTMTDYRLFRFHPVTGLASEEILRADDDAEATRIMHETMGGASCELWLGTRLVALVDPANPDAL
jgi:hypothetical protein